MTFKKNISKLFLFTLLIVLGSPAKAQNSTTPNIPALKIKELDFTPIANPNFIKMDTAQGNLWIASVLDSSINIQFIKKETHAKFKEINIPLGLNNDEQLADIDIINNHNLTILLKTFTTESIKIKHIQIDGPGLISIPKTLLSLTNHHLNLVIEEKNKVKSVNEQVSWATSANKKYFAVINKQSLVCSSIDAKGLEITSYDDHLNKQSSFVESNCAFKDIHIFNSGKIAITKSENQKIIFDLYLAHFKTLIYHYQFAEITKTLLSDETVNSDTFDQQVQFYFNDATQKVYGFIKGFINNVRITHVGMFVYDAANEKLILSNEKPLEIKSFINYSMTYRDFYQGYSYEYPMHLQIRYIKEVDNKFEIIADYMSYGNIPLGEHNAGLAQSKATYLIQLGPSGNLISTDILLHQQSIINYSSRNLQSTTENPTIAYVINKDNVNTKVGQMYLYDDNINFVIHNEDEKSFYNADRLYKFTYYGKDGKAAGVEFTPNGKTKYALDSLANYTLLPMQASFQLSPREVVVFATENKTVKLLSLSLAKP